MNKKGFESYLVVIVFGLMIVTSLISMYTFGNRINSETSAASDLMSQATFSEQYIDAQAKLIAKDSISACPGCDVDQLTATTLIKAKEREDLYLNENAGNLFAKIRNGDFILIQQADKTYKFQIPLSGDPIMIQAKVDANKITRAYELCMLFDEQGRFISDCQEQN